MKATSVQNIKNVKDVSFLLADDTEIGSNFTIIARTNDDVFEFEFEGGLDLLQSCKAAGLFTGWEKDQRIKFLEAEIGRWKKEAADCLKLRDEVRREKNKEINNLKWQLQDKGIIKTRNDELKEKNRELTEENEKLKEAFDKECEKLTFEKMMLKEENKQLKEEISRCNKVNEDLGSNAIKLERKMLKYKQRQAQKIKALKKELALEKAANEAQHRFIREYAGKDTEVQFNYAIDDVKEVSYVIVDRDKYNKDREKWANAQVENAPVSTSREDILDQAKKCVCGQREQDYGTPESNFQLIADLWNGYLGEKTDNPVISVTPVDVSMMMALMKITRIRNGGGSGDSFVDLAGYAACGGEIWHGQKAKDQN